MSEKKSLSKMNLEEMVVTPRLWAFIGGVVCIFGGISLAWLKAESENSMIESIANGMGYYFIGKGIYMIAMVLELRATVQRFFSQQDLQEKNDKPETADI
jgi:hypothetical protein